MGKISYTFSMMGASWEVLKKDKELLVFPLLSGICCILVIVSFALPLWMTGAVDQVQEWEKMTPLQKTADIAIMFLFYFCNYFVIIFFNSAIVACAVVRMRGGNPTLSTGLNAAMTRLPQILGWALVSATISVILRVIENTHKKAGRWIAAILGAAWAITTFLVVPVLVVEKKGPIEAFKESTRLLKKTWGEQLIGNFGFGIVFFLLGIPGIALLIFGIMALAGGGVGAALAVLLIAAGILYIILLGLIQSALQVIFQAALYLYAKDGQAPAGFNQNTLGNAMAHR